MRWPWTISALLAFAGVAEAGEVPLTFERDIQPILVRCAPCHGSAKSRGGLRLDARGSATGILDSGHRAIVPRNPEESELLRRVASTQSRLRMPPKGKPLSTDQVEKLRHWIGSGADWPTHWAYRSLAKPKPPTTLGAGYERWERTPIDRFILAQLRARGLAPAPEADKRTLLRRVYFDLIGLPPSPSTLAAFLAQNAPDAYEQMVDQLLASPQYGERWARHWMDVVHFAETHGHDQDRPREHAWPYRDYLIQSFNADKPYPKFVREQVAGDVLFSDDSEAIVATGFLAAGPWDESSLRDIREDSLDREIGRNLDRDDIVTTVMNTFVSTTVQCARCHDHKFDPITQREYYGLQAVFAGIDKANRPYDIDHSLAQRRQQLAASELPLIALRFAPAPFSLYSLGGFHLANKIDRELSCLPPQLLVYCGTNQFLRDGSFTPASCPRPIHVLMRGDIRMPGPLAQPATLACISGLEHSFGALDPENEGNRRARLADWLTDPRNGLAWRSIVNRIWQYHFGRGLVDTPNDFGRMGSAPTHPELLDWLAITLEENGGSLKRLHRLIVTSSVYRQSCRLTAASAAIDADNYYLWHMNRCRLDAESIHDAAVYISGKLDQTMGGPSVKQFIQKPGVHVTPIVDYAGFDPDDAANFRRSVYRFLFRTIPDPFMETLDCPDGAQLTPVRTASVTALQALALFNDKFMARQAEHIAHRVAGVAQERDRQVVLLYEWILGRQPTGRESQAVRIYADKHGLANACRVLLNCNEFVFLD